MNDPEYIEIIPNKFPEGSTMRAETIRNWLKGICFIILITVVLFGLLWGTP